MNKWNSTLYIAKLYVKVFGVVAICSANNTTKAANPPSITATYTVTTQKPTCDLGLITAPNLQLDDLRQESFRDANSPGRAQGKIITLQLTNCNGYAGAGVPKISVYGDRDGVTDPNLYRKSTSVAQGVGFVLTLDNNGVGSILPAGTISNPTIVDIQAIAGVDPNNKTIDFFVQASRGNQPYTGVTSGVLTSDLHFDFLYE